MARFEQPRAPDAPPKVPNHFELALYEFEKRCQKFHTDRAKAAPADETPNQTEERATAFEKEWEHLQCERARILVMTQIQAELEQYRKDSRNKSLGELRKETHHPTDDLRKHLAAVGEPRPSPQHDAHHIIPGKGQYQHNQIMQARTNLHLAGIGIQDACNGLYLPSTKADKGHWSMPDAPAHTEIHRFNYETWIFRRFATHRRTEEMLRVELRLVKTLIRDGQHPQKILEPKDPSWVGT